MLQSWGRYPRISTQQVVAVVSRTEQLPEFEELALPYGNGRSYGDSCLCPDGTLLEARGLDRFIEFDTDSGELECEAGMKLRDIIDLALPLGWFLPVTPGTQFVTVGGAIANDVHGKNHHFAGSFGDHVLSFDLIRSDGMRRSCSRKNNSEWFAATVGGLGLTGMIVSARLQLRRVPGPCLNVETQRFANLSEFHNLTSGIPNSEYAVAWVDCLAKGPHLGRGVLMRADHTCAPPSASRKKQLRIPVSPPVSIVNKLSLSLFNSIYFLRAPRHPRRRLLHYLPYFYPLDRIVNWNLLYGPRGFLQYQCVVPPSVAVDAIAELLSRIAGSGQGSFLAVLKQFGDRRGPGLLSFPRPGTTLALDFPNRGEPTLRLLNELDATVTAAGGAVYPAKDARMPAATFLASFPELERFRQYLDPRFSSGLWRRVTEGE